jgi:nucleoside-diphosphate-sugar epimerase
MKWFEVERVKATESLQRRRIARINRTRPPVLGPSNIEELRATYRYTPNSYHKGKQNADDHNYHKKDEAKYEHYQEKRDYCGHHAENAFATYPSFYDPLKHMINEDSVIVITGILGRIGFHLALKLSSCNAKVIVAIDRMYPNDPPYRLRQLQQLAHLFAKVPHLNKPFILTYDGINPKNNYHPSFEKIINELNGELDFGVFQPTHIVHLANAEMNIYDSGDSDGIYEFRQSLIGLEQLLASFSQVDTDLHFILASSILVHEDHQEYIMRDDVISKKKIFQASKEMEETMVKLFAETYNQHTVLILRLPKIYGPWGKLGNFDYDIVSVATSNWGTEGMTKIVSDESMSLLYIDGTLTKLFLDIFFLYNLNLLKISYKLSRCG